MPTQVLMPRLGESVVEGTVVRWFYQEGETVERMAPLLEISTDKVDTEVPSPAAGVLLRVLAPVGATVAVGTVIAIIGQPGDQETGGPGDREAGKPGNQETRRPGNRETGGPGDRESGRVEGRERKGENEYSVAFERVQPAAPGQAADLGFISPVVARLAAEHGIDLGQIRGTGLKGRIRKQDILAFLERRPDAGLQPPPSDLHTPTAAPRPTPPSAGEILPLNRMRRLIAEHMVHSKRTAPHVTTVFDCDLTAVVRHRYAHQEAFARDGADLTFTPYFIASLAEALKQHPLANSSWTDEGIRLHRGVHIGVAVAIPDGLIVPVIKNVDSYSLLGLARAVNDLAQRARSGNLAPDEVQGGTFTLTNHGVSGSLFAAPIIHQPQTGILGVGKIHKEPVVISRGHPLLPDAEDVIAIRPIAYLSFTFDHRVLDGATADAFVSTIKERIEQWR